MTGYISYNILGVVFLMYRSIYMYVLLYVCIHDETRDPVAVKRLPSSPSVR